MTQPLKRHAALQPLSREHHYALLLCWKVKRGLELGVDLTRISRYVMAMWHHQIAEHFGLEERLIFSVLGGDHADVKCAIADHRLLEKLMLTEPPTVEQLHQIVEVMETHVRLEERTIYPEVQKIATEEQLKNMEIAHHEAIAEMEWKDQFWV